MPTFYYEFADIAEKRLKFPHKYGFKVVNDYRKGSAFGIGLQFVYCAERIWIEHDDGTITWAKNRFGTLNQAVDLEEFFWIKLKCHRL